MKITSVNNEIIKETSKLLISKYRDEKGLFILEGIKGIEEAFNANLEILKIFVEENSSEQIYPLLQNKDIIYEVSEAVMKKISDAKTPSKAIAVVKKPNVKWSDDYKNIILLDGIKDPGNLGTIIRTASAFSVDAIILYGDTVDLFNPKCVRATVGNLWKIPIFKFEDLKHLKGYEFVATLPNGENVINIKDYKPARKTIVMFGSEAKGLSEELKQMADKNITISMKKTVESLNLSVSAGIIMNQLFN
ncbi:MAG: RNA methyltransferase [bacterium]|nr:RNA methyltransferase [bacterium]